MCESHQLLTIRGLIPGLFIPQKGCGDPQKERLAAETRGIGDSKVATPSAEGITFKGRRLLPETGKVSCHVDTCGPLPAARGWGAFCPPRGPPWKPPPTQLGGEHRWHAHHFCR